MRQNAKISYMGSGEHIFELTSKGEILIPAELAEELSLKGNKVAVRREGDALVVRPAPVSRGMTRGAGAVREEEHRKDRFDE